MRVAADPALIVIAKEPRPGRAKTRLSPPCTPEQAARLAEASLADTLAAVAGADASRRVLVLDGRPGDWVPAGFEVVSQVGGGLEKRLAAAFEAVGGPAFLVGMDTPQLTSELIDRAVAKLRESGTDAVLGPATDGGYWAIGLRSPDRAVFEGVPMSTSFTGRAQLRALETAGLVTSMLPELSDVDTFETAIAVAGECPGTRFARILDSVLSEHDQRSLAVASR